MRRALAEFLFVPSITSITKSILTDAAVQVTDLGDFNNLIQYTAAADTQDVVKHEHVCFNGRMIEVHDIKFYVVGIALISSAVTFISAAFTVVDAL